MRPSFDYEKKLKKTVWLFTALIVLLAVTIAPVSAVSQYVQVSVSPSTVIHGNSFTASINGISDHQYTISISGPGTAPQITPGQVGVSGSGTTATVTTDVGGRRTVAFTTTRSTSKQQFKITVTNTQDTSDYDSDTVWVTEGTVSIVATEQPETQSDGISLSIATTSQADTVPPTPSPTPLPTTVEPTTSTATPTEEETQTTPGFLAPAAIFAVAALVALLIKRR